MFITRNMVNKLLSKGAKRCLRFASTDIERLRKCQLEFNSGAGGLEAMLFTKDLFKMYTSFVARRNGWSWHPIQLDGVEFGGLRSGIIAIEGEECYAMLRFEAGVHRVQRMPLTDKSRVHTSTSSVSVLPEPENPEADLNPKDCKMEVMRASGPGGMNVNKRESAVRLTHLPTGISVKCKDERFQYDNIKIAYRRLGSILLQREVDKLSSKYDSNRKLQVSSLARAAKIRTYNFKENRITDHRLKYSVNRLQDFLEGGESFEEMLERLHEAFVLQTLEEEQEESIRRRQSATPDGASC